MPRPSNTESRRAEIVRALSRTIATSGFARSTTAAIAREAGLSQGLIHYHFRNKMSILLALIDELESRLRARFVERSAHANNPQARLNAFIDAHLAIDESTDPSDVRCWVSIASQAIQSRAVHDAYAAVVARSLDALEPIVAELLRTRGKRSTEARRISAGVLAGIHGAYQLGVVADVIPTGTAAGSIRSMAAGAIAFCEDDS